MRMEAPKWQSTLAYLFRTKKSGIFVAAIISVPWRVFGSVPRADFRTDSDVDLLVEFEPGAQVGLMLLSRMQRELADLLDRPIDLVPRDGLKPSICESVLTTAQVIYAV
jgi:uncharacterized protein